MVKEKLIILKRNFFINLIWIFYNLKKNSKYFLIFLLFFQFSITSILFGTWKVFGLKWHLFFLLIFLVVFFYLLVLIFKNYKYYNKNYIRLWVDEKNFTSVNPLVASNDRPADDKYNKSLWYFHKINIKDNLKNIKFQIPVIAFNKDDPLKVRFLFLLFLLISLYWSIQNEKFYQNMLGVTELGIYKNESDFFKVTAWVSPPNYTNLKRRLIDISQGYEEKKIKELVPINSVLNLFIQSNNNNFFIKEYDRKIEIRENEKYNYEANLVVEKTKTIHIKNQRKPYLNFDLSVIQDKKPKIKFLSSPHSVNDISLSFISEASDDYGVKKVDVFIKTPIEFSHFIEEHMVYNTFDNISLAQGSKSVESYFYENLSRNIWAGSNTILEIRVLDFAKQSSSLKKQIKIPKKTFKNNIANKILKTRDKLAKNFISIKVFSEEFNEIFQSNKYLLNNEIINSYHIDIIKFLEKKEKFEHSTSNELFDKLYQLAEIIEEGENFFTKKNLEQIEQNLFDSIKDKDADEVISNAQRFKDSIESLLELKKENQKDIKYNDKLKQRYKDQIDQLTKQIEDLLKTGSKEGIKAKMHQLKQLSESIKNPNENKEKQTKFQEKKEFINKLSELLNDQEKVMEETFNRAADRGKFKQSSKGSGGKSPKERQEELRNTLGNVMREIGASENEIPQELGRADRAMRQASRDLENGRPDEAANSQGMAVEMIQKSINKIDSEQFISDLPQITKKGEKSSSDNTNREFSADNENLEYQGTSAGGKLNISKQREVKNASKIADMLYKRYNQEYRSINEKKHIKNLLDWH